MLNNIISLYCADYKFKYSTLIECKNENFDRNLWSSTFVSRYLSFFLYVSNSCFSSLSSGNNFSMQKNINIPNRDQRPLLM